MSGHELNSQSERTLYSYSNFIFCSVSDLISAKYIFTFTFKFKWTQKCTVSLANQLRVVADEFHSLRTHQRF